MAGVLAVARIRKECEMTNEQLYVLLSQILTLLRQEVDKIEAELEQASGLERDEQLYREGKLWSHGIRSDQEYALAKFHEGDPDFGDDFEARMDGEFAVLKGLKLRLRVLGDEIRVLKG